MDYISQYFNKPSSELNYQDIVNFFQVEQEESDKIEFKSFVEEGGGPYKDKEKGVLRSICGFLNSGGGIVIWGAPRGQVVAERKEKAFVGALSPLNIRIEKDAFISKITNSITPAPVGVRFIGLQNGESYIYVIEVQKSDYSPHQFSNTYFMRIDGQTNPAPHHYVEALFRKITYPRLLGYVVLEKLEYHNGVMGNDMMVLSVSVAIFNLSKLQNENKPFFRLVTGIGTLLGNGIGPSLNKEYFMGNHEVRSSVPLNPVYYNAPVRISEIIRLNPHVLARNNWEFDLWLYVAGENSPMIESKYKVRFEYGNAVPEDLNSLFTLVDENRYTYERSDELGVTEEERISQILGRNIGNV